MSAVNQKELLLIKNAIRENARILRHLLFCPSGHIYFQLPVYNVSLFSRRQQDEMTFPKVIKLLLVPALLPGTVRSAWNEKKNNLFRISILVLKTNNGVISIFTTKQNNLELLPYDVTSRLTPKKRHKALGRITSKQRKCFLENWAIPEER